MRATRPPSRPRRGSVLPMLALCLVSVFAFVALAVDLGVLAVSRTHCQNAADVAALRAQGLATTSVLNRELVCQGVELFFDTTDQRDAYLADYLDRFPAEPPYLPGDPCRPFRDSPRYVVGE